MFDTTILQLGGQGPLVALLAGIVAIVLLLVVLDLPPFIALVVAGLVVGIVTPQVAFAEIPGEFEDVVDRLEEYRDALDEDVHFVFRPYAPGIETKELLECIRRLGEEVVPRL